MPLSLFPVRAAIGQAILANGERVNVTMSMEYAKAMADLSERVGGTNGASNTELSSLIKALQLQAVNLGEQLSALGEITRALESALDEQAMSEVFATDSDHATRVQVDGATIEQAMSPGTPSGVVQSLADMAVSMAFPDKSLPIQKNTVTGAKAGNAALTSLLVALAKSGIITDLST